MIRARKICHTLADSTPCPVCGGEMAREWQGRVYILNPQKSEIAKEMGVTSSGRYALRVRG